MSIIWGMYSVALGSTSAFCTLRVRMSAWNSSMYRSEISLNEVPSSLARAMILSSTSVKFLTNVRS